MCHLNDCRPGGRIPASKVATGTVPARPLTLTISDARHGMSITNSCILQARGVPQGAVYLSQCDHGHNPEDGVGGCGFIGRGGIVYEYGYEYVYGTTEH